MMQPAEQVFQNITANLDHPITDSPIWVFTKHTIWKARTSGILPTGPSNILNFEQTSRWNASRQAPPSLLELADQGTRSKCWQSPRWTAFASLLPPWDVRAGPDTRTNVEPRTNVEQFERKELMSLLPLP